MKKFILITNLFLLLGFTFNFKAKAEEFDYDAKIEIIGASYGDHSDGSCPKQIILTFKVTNVGKKEIHGLAIKGLYIKNGQPKSMLKIGSNLTKVSPSGGEIPSYNIPGLPSGTNEVLRIQSLNPGESNTYTTKVPFEPSLSSSQKILNSYKLYFPWRPLFSYNADPYPWEDEYTSEIDQNPKNNNALKTYSGICPEKCSFEEDESEDENEYIAYNSDGYEGHCYEELQVEENPIIQEGEPIDLENEEEGTVAAPLIYPNPIAQGQYLTIKLGESTGRIFHIIGVYSGELILEGTIPKEENAISISTEGWSSGLYVIKTSDEEGNSVSQQQIIVD